MDSCAELWSEFIGSATEAARAAAPGSGSGGVITAALGDGHGIEFAGPDAESNTVCWGDRSSQSVMVETGGASGNQKIDTTAATLPNTALACASIQVNEASPTQITSNQNNYDPGDAGVLRLATDASRTITGFQKGLRGRYLTIVNVGANTLNLAHQSANSSEANRIIVPGGSALALSPDRSAVLWYDDVSDRWRVTGFTT